MVAAYLWETGSGPRTESASHIRKKSKLFCHCDSTSTNNIILIFFKGSVTKHVTTVPTTGSNILTVTKVP
jgi:hypothetical protein